MWLEAVFWSRVVPEEAYRNVFMVPWLLGRRWAALVLVAKRQTLLPICGRMIRLGWAAVVLVAKRQTLLLICGRMIRLGWAAVVLVATGDRSSHRSLSVTVRAPSDSPPARTLSLSTMTARVSWARRLSGHPTLSAALVYVGLIAAVYSPVVFLGRSLQAPLYYPGGMLNEGPYGQQGPKPVNAFNVELSSAAWGEWPVDVLVGRAYRQGELPLWDPYQAAGTPLAAQYSTKTFFPYQVLLDVSPVDTWDFWYLGRLWVAGFFTFLFLRRLSLSWAAALFGGVAYMFSGTFAWFINFESFVNIAMVAPILLWSVEGLWQWKWRHAVPMAGFAVALVLVAGHPSVALFVLILGAAYGLYRLACTPASARFPPFSAALVAGPVGIMLAAPLLLPFYEFSSASFTFHRSGGTMGVQDPANPVYAFSILVPSLYRTATFYRDTPVNGLWDNLGGYLGVTPVFLTLLGLGLVLARESSRWRGHLLFFSAFGLVVVLKNFGHPLVSWVGYLPLLDQSWSPRAAGPAWTLAFAVASALGIEALRDQAAGSSLAGWARAGVSWSRPFLRQRFWPSLLGATCLAAPLAILPLLEFYLSSVPSEVIARGYFFPSVVVGTGVALAAALACALLTRSYLGGEAPIAAFTAVALLELWFGIPLGYSPNQDVLRLLPLLAGVAAVLALARSRYLWSGAACLGAVLLVLALDSAAESRMPQRYDAATPAPYVGFLQAQEGYSRVMGGNGVLMPNFASAVGLQDVRYLNSMVAEPYLRFRMSYLQPIQLPGGRGAAGNTLWFTGSPNLGSYVPGLAIRQSFDFGEQVGANLPFYSLLGVRFFLTPKDYEFEGPPPESDEPRLPLVYDGEVKIYENRDALPRAFIADRIRTARGYEDAQAALGSPGFDLAKTVVLEEPLPDSYRDIDLQGPGSSTDGSSAFITHLGLNSVVLEAESFREALLVLTDAYDPGWRAWVDGQEVPVVRVDGLFRGVRIGPGKHVVEFRYLPRSFLDGAGLAAAALFVCMVLLVAPWRAIGTRYTRG